MKEPVFTSATAIRDNCRVLKSDLLREDSLHKDPFIQFNSWLEEAIAAGIPDPNAMILSTTGSDHLPNSRVVLLREVSHGGFTFFTNYNSKKGKEIRENPRACLLFFWPLLMRQIKVQGEISYLSGQASDAYFSERPFGNQVGAWTSQQSQVVASREELDRSYGADLLHFDGRPVPRPPYWGGYVLRPSRFEFWQGQESRLHDRLRYSSTNDEQRWQIERLMP